MSLVTLLVVLMRSLETEGSSRIELLLKCTSSNVILVNRFPSLRNHETANLGIKQRLPTSMDDGATTFSNVQDRGSSSCSLTSDNVTRSISFVVREVDVIFEIGSYFGRTTC